MRSIDHKNIVKFYDAVISDRNYYIFMEYCSGPSLTDKMYLYLINIIIDNQMGEVFVFQKVIYIFKYTLG